MRCQHSFMCWKCKCWYATSEAKKLHTCNSILDQYFLTYKAVNGTPRKEKVLRSTVTRNSVTKLNKNKPLTRSGIRKKRNRDNFNNNYWRIVNNEKPVRSYLKASKTRPQHCQNNTESIKEDKNHDNVLNSALRQEKKIEAQQSRTSKPNDKKATLKVEVIKGKNYHCGCFFMNDDCKNCHWKNKMLFSSNITHTSFSPKNSQKNQQVNKLRVNRCLYQTSSRITSKRKSFFHTYFDKNLEIAKKTSCESPSRTLKIALVKCKNMIRRNMKCYSSKKVPKWANCFCNVHKYPIGCFYKNISK